ncbi:MAG TPA: Do family serine endopeptidase [Polyangiaceae bacterium]|nr:Do family serine endopeptidase [Polyangiaceae bacterium]
MTTSALLFGWAGGSCSTGVKPAASAQAPEASHTSEAARVDDKFVAVAERLAPSVVRVTTRQRASTAMTFRSPDGDPFEGTPFEDFFRRLEPRSSEPPEPRVGMGSGVVIDHGGHILTNQHVVAGAENVKVTFVDGKEIDAKVVGTDPKTDLAVIKVDRSDLTPAEFGDSDKMHVGEWVIAIGNPFGLDHSVTVGVLSAKGRYGFAEGQLEDFLQTDASINPGNSGGPLVNLDGRVVGINTMIAGIGTGVGFAVSEGIAKPIVQQLIEHGTVTRPYIGVVMQTLTPELRQAIGNGAPEKGALVSEVQDGSPAQKAGIKAGDIVVEVQGKATEDSREVQRVVLAQKVGEMLDVTVWRDGKEMTMKVQSAALPAGSPAAPGRAGPGGDLGLELQTLTPELAQRFGLDPTTKGAVVAGVRPGSPAAEAGVRSGDVIVGVDRAPVANAGDAAKDLGTERAAGHLVHVRRGDRALYLVIPKPR